MEIITVVFNNGVIKAFRGQDDMDALNKAYDFAYWKGIKVEEYCYGDYED